MMWSQFHFPTPKSHFSQKGQNVGVYFPPTHFITSSFTVRFDIHISDDYDSFPPFLAGICDFGFFAIFGGRMASDVRFRFGA